MNTSIPMFEELNRTTSSSSETSFTTTNDAAQSEEEVILAPTRPKKRSGRRVFKETRHPVYKGVRARDNNKWVCEMRVPKDNKSRIWLGTYPTAEMAARAYDVAALVLRGKSASLNFANSAWRVTLPESTDALVIRKAAMKAAELIAAEDEIYNQQCLSTLVEDIDDNNNKPYMQQAMYLDLLLPTVSSEYEDFHDLLLSIADEPLMSPPHSTRDYGSDDSDDVDIFEAQIQLWNY